MNRWTLAIIVTGLILITVAVLYSSEEVAQDSPVVRSVTVDFDSRLILVEGERLFRSPVVPRLALGSRDLFVCPACFDETHIFADLPSDLQTGEYKLNISVSRSAISRRRPDLVYPLTISGRSSQNPRIRAGESIAPENSR